METKNAKKPSNEFTTMLTEAIVSVEDATLKLLESIEELKPKLETLAILNKELENRDVDSFFDFYDNYDIPVMGDFDDCDFGFTEMVERNILNIFWSTWDNKHCLDMRFNLDTKVIDINDIPNLKKTWE